MPRPRLSLAAARISGAAAKNPQRYRRRTGLSTGEPIGDPPPWMNKSQRAAWRDLAARLPWLERTHRAHLAVTCSIYGRVMAGQDVGVQALNLLRLCLGQLCATPTSAGNVPAPEVDDDDLLD